VDSHTLEVIIFHGGGFVQGSKAIVPRIQIEELGRLGFVVVVPNFRLCPQVSVYNGPVKDARDCLLWVQNSLSGLLTGVLINTNRIVTMGHSSGAALAGLLVSR
jgi:acetyl esterase/lipase